MFQDVIWNWNLKLTKSKRNLNDTCHYITKQKMFTELFFLACGMYIGKYYPEYVPFSRIRQDHIDTVLAYLKSLQQQPTPPTNELKIE